LGAFLCRLKPAVSSGRFLWRRFGAILRNRFPSIASS
jgi:hypothetical protein